jgi:hypothetical protein
MVIQHAHCGDQIMLADGEKLKGQSTTVWIEGDTLVIKYAVWAYGFLGEKRVPVENIKAVSWKEPGTFIAGFLEISILGEAPPSPFANANVQRQNRLQYEKQDVEKWRDLRDWIEANRTAQRAATAPASNAEQLGKLGELLEKGLLTREEFESEKAKLL